MLHPHLPSTINEVALRLILAQLDEGRRRSLVGDDWNHFHLTHTADQRFTEEGELLQSGVAYQLTVCPGWKCGEPDDGGIVSWNRWRQDRQLEDIESTGARSDEEMAAVAISALVSKARIEWILEDNRLRTADLKVVLPDGRTAHVEVTMHTDRARRELLRAQKRHSCPALSNEWHIVAYDSRFVEQYDGSNGFRVNDVGETVAEVLARAEATEVDLDNFDRIGELCEAEVARTWRWTRNNHLATHPPLTLRVIQRMPTVEGLGGVYLWLAPVTHNVRQVVDVSDLTAAIQQSIDHKLGRNQWGDTTDQKWLVIVLDGGEPEHQLLNAFELDEHQSDFGGLEFPGIDEVWTVAFEEGNLTVLRFIGSETCWEYHHQIPAPTV